MTKISSRSLRLEVPILIVIVFLGGLLLPSPHAHASTCVMGSASGFVKDVFGRPLSGARVAFVDPDPDRPGCYGGPVLTDASGHYKIAMRFCVGCSWPAQASKTGFASETHSIYVSLTAVNDPRNDFVLKHDMTASLSPAAIRSGESLSITASTTAPPPSENPGSRVIAQLPSGLSKNLTQGATDSNGWTTWTGTHTPPAGDGTFTIKVCGVRETFVGNCDQAASINPAQTVTRVVSLQYKVDDSPPMLIGVTVLLVVTGWIAAPRLRYSSATVKGWVSMQEA